MSDLFASPYDELRPGAAFTTRARTVTEADVASFAALTWDTHPQHTDAEFARRSPFGARIAHGMMVIAFAIGLVPFDPRRVVALRRVRDAVFKAPVQIGETLSVRGSVARLTPVDAAHGLVACELRIVNASGSTAARATVEVLWRAGRETDEQPVGDATTEVPA